VTRSWLAPSARLLVGIGVPLALLAFAWRHVDPGEGLRLVVRAGPLTALALLPYAALLAFDALGWRLLFTPATRARGSFADTLAARAAGEAVSQSLPSAGIAGEATAAWLLSSHTGAPLGEVIGTLAARRLLLVLGHGLTLGLGALATAAGPFPAPRALAWVLGLGSSALVALALAGPVLLVRGAPFARLHLALRRVPWAWLRAWLDTPSVRLPQADREAVRLFARERRVRLATAACFALVYVTESLETLLLLRILGTRISILQVLSFEPLLSLVRGLAFFVPAGLGFQDLGYVAFFRALGLKDAASVGAAFVLLKRLKEIVWIGAGWLVLLAADSRTRASATAAREEHGERWEAPGPVHLRDAQPDDTDAPDRAGAVGA
jgi:hypothetical protein